MLKKSKNKVNSLSQKLKDAVTDLSVDIFGYQKKVTNNIISNTEFISNKIKVPKERLFLKIFQKDHTIKSFLFNQSKPIQVLPIDELAYFFVDSATVNVLSIQNKIAFGIKKYLSDFAKTNKLDSESIDIWIHVKDEKVMIQAFSVDGFIQEITISSLIKFFR